MTHWQQSLWGALLRPCRMPRHLLHPCLTGMTSLGTLLRRRISVLRSPPMPLQSCSRGQPPC